VLIALALVVAAVVLVAVRAGDPVAKAAGRTRNDRGGPHPTVVPPTWSRTLPGWAATMLDAGGDLGVVVGDDWVTAVTLTTGTLRWEVPLPGAEPVGALRADTVLLATGSGFVALERDTGKVRWQLDTAETPGPVALVSPGGRPQVAVVSTVEGGLVGIDSLTGRTRWSVRLAGRPRGVPAVDDASGAVATVWQPDADGTRLRVVDGATGALRWEQPLPVMAGSPVIAHGAVAIGAGAGRHDSAVHAFALADGARRWQARVPAPFQPDLVPRVAGTGLFVVDQLGHVTRLDAASGARVWSTNTRALDVHARPLAVRDAVLVGNEAGEVITLDRANGAIRARRRPAGLPVGLAASGRVVVVAQRLVERHAVQAFAAARIAAPARSRR
jgi:outer membrane protein assembly factor BamB